MFLAALIFKLALYIGPHTIFYPAHCTWLHCTPYQYVDTPHGGLYFTERRRRRRHDRGDVIMTVGERQEIKNNRLNLISEERVNISKHNSENLMKISWEIRKFWHIEVLTIFIKHFLTSRYDYANYEWIDDVIASLLAIYFVHKILKILIFCPNLW